MEFPALVCNLCIFIVFLRMCLVDGVARYRFVPLAEAVVFAMLASYVLCRTLVPTLAMYLLKTKVHRSESRNLFSRIQRSFERLFEQIRTVYRRLLTSLLANRRLFVLGFLWLCRCCFLLV